MSLDTIIAELQELNTALKTLQSGGVSTKRIGKRKPMSAEGRAKIQAAQKLRWSEIKAKKKKSTNA